MVAFYQHDIAAWMDGTESLSDGEYRAYHIVVQMIYQHNGPIVAHESGIAGRCNQHPLAFRKNLQKLLDAGKIVRTADGKLANGRADSELKKIASRRRKYPSDPKPTPAEPGGGAAGVQRGSAGGSAAKPLKNKEATLFGEALDNRIKDKNVEAIASTATPLEDVRTKLFRGGFETLVRISGKPPAALRTLVGRWLRDTRDDAVAVLRAIEDAELNRVAEPVAWIERALRARHGPGAPATKNGRAAIAARFAEQRRNEANGRADSKPEFSGFDEDPLPADEDAGVRRIPPNRH